MLTPPITQAIAWTGRHSACIVSVLLIAACAVPARLLAQESAQESALESVDPAVTRTPPRYVAFASVGVPMRLNVEPELGQGRFAPAFTDVLLGYIPPSEHALRHGFGLGVAWNLGRDGGFLEPVYAVEQLLLMPAYLAYTELAPDLPLVAHVGVPVLLQGGKSFGLELGGSIAYRALAGLGVFAGIAASGFVGARNAVHVLLSGELGVLIEYEVLP